MKRKAIIKSLLQKRAEDLKTLTEQRAELVVEMKELAERAQKEERAMSEDEDKHFDELEAKVKSIDKTIEKMKRARDMKFDKEPEQDKDKQTVEEMEERAFERYIRSVCAGEPYQERAGEQNITMGNNGAVIPTTIANRIITVVKDICPIFEKATIYNVKGTLKIPKWGLANSTHDITVSYQEEFTDITADAGKFTSIDLSGYLAGALVLIGKSVVNNTGVDVVGFVVAEMAKKISEFLEKELLVGTSGKATGALSCSNKKETAAATAITADELIELQAAVKQTYQKDACWVMNPDTFTAVRKLKDANNRYLLQDDVSGEFPYRLLGKPVYLSDNMPKIAASAKTVLYGDLSGLSVNMRENISIQVLLEKYATQHAVGFVSWFEFDSNVTDEQKLAVLEQKAS